MFALNLRVTLFAGLPKSVKEQEVCVCVMDEQRGVILAYLLVLND